MPGQPLNIRVALVEDDDKLRGSLRALLQRTEGFSVVAEYADAESTLAGIARDGAEVVLMDINLPGMDGVECVRKLKGMLPEIQVLMLTVYEDNDQIFNSIVAGANGYLLKRTVTTSLVSAIREVHAGGAPMTPQIARRVLQHFRAATPDPAVVESLTPREKQVLDELAGGEQFKQISQTLGISIDGVRFHIRRIYAKLHVHSRTEAVVKYLQR